MKLFIMLFIFIGLFACNDEGTVNSGTDQTILETTASPAITQQIFETSKGIRVVIPGGSLNNNFEIKLIKLAVPPKLSSSNLILGSNIFKLSLNDDLKFKNTIELRVKYDKSKIKSGLTPISGVKGMFYTDNTWYETEVTIDVINEEIIFPLISENGKVNKYVERFLENTEIIFGDGYSTTDTGQNDDFITLMHKCFNISIDFSGVHNGLNNNEFSSIHIPLNYNFTSLAFTDTLIWNNNSFSANVEPNTKITGTIDSKAKTISLTVIAEEQKIWEDTTIFKCKIELINVPYENDDMIFGHTFTVYGGGQSVKDVVKSIEFTKTVKDKQGVKVENYINTDYTKNAVIEIEMMHYK